MISNTPDTPTADGDIAMTAGGWRVSTLARIGDLVGALTGGGRSTEQGGDNAIADKKGNEMQTQSIANNGVNVEALLGAREALTEAPEAAMFKWRARCEWIDGAHSRSTVDGFFGLGAEQRRPQPHVVDADHPAEFAAMDNGATPVELVLSALASCLTAGVASVAQNRGIQLRSVKASVEGHMDIAGILGIDPEVRNGFSMIRVHFDIDSDATADEIAAVVAQSQKRSAVFDILTNPTNVHVDGA